MAELATLTRNRVVPAGATDEAAFEVLAEATPLQARAAMEGTLAVVTR